MKKSKFEDCKIKVRKTDPEFTPVNFIIKTALSLNIDRKLIDLKLTGVKLSKAEYLARCVEAGHIILTEKYFN